jgi:SAM-dependent methyltransferase
MNLLDIVQRTPAPEPWAEGEKIPWNEPGFSARMLAEHLTQEHDAASRRAERIDEQVRWIHQHLLQGRPSRVLDLGCGPGLYTQRLAALGHSCVGIDFGPASIAHARAQASANGADCVYIEGDIRSTDFGPDGSYDLAMLIYGELNVFRRTDAIAILQKAWRALAPGGLLLLEPHTFEAVREEGQRPSTWYTSENGLFSERPHLALYEAIWHAAQAVTIHRYFIVDAETGAVTRYASSMCAYTSEGYRQLLADAGFGEPVCYPSLTGQADRSQSQLLAIVVRR